MERIVGSRLPGDKEVFTNKRRRFIEILNSQWPFEAQE
jgi:hypothetical protein